MFLVDNRKIPEILMKKIKISGVSTKSHIQQVF